jgi:hypothetical protein
MNHQDLRIGNGPDFVMTIGKLMQSHYADVQLAFESGAVSRAPATNASLGALVKEIQEKLVAIGWVQEDGFNLTSEQGFIGNAQGNRGTATIRFKFPKEITKKQELRMRIEIQKLFR